MSTVESPRVTAPIPFRIRHFLEQIAENGGRLTSAEAQRLLDRHAPHSFIDDALEIVVEIEACHRIQREIKAAFVGQALEGGALAALEHPLYVRATERMAELRAELMLVI